MALIIVKAILVAIIVIESMNSILELWLCLIYALQKYENINIDLRKEVIMLTLSISILSVI